MARRKKSEIFNLKETREMLELNAGFYIVDENQSVKTKEVTKGKPGEERRTVVEPIRFRTIAGAKDALTIAGGRCGILCVTDTLDWPL